MAKKIYFKNSSWDYLFPGHDRDEVGDHKVFCRPKAQDTTLGEARFLWEVESYPGEGLLIRNASYGYLFGSEIRIKGDCTVWCREKPSDEDLRHERFRWDIVATGNGYQLRNRFLGFAFAANDDKDAGDHFVELRPGGSNTDPKFAWNVTEWAFGSETLSDLRYWQLELNASGEWLSPVQRERFSQIVPTAFRGIDELFVMVHGMGNDRTDARNIYSHYVNQLRATAGALGIPADQVARMGVCGIVWPSGGKVDYVPEGAQSVVRGGAKFVGKVVGVFSDDAERKIKAVADTFGGPVHTTAQTVARGVAAAINQILQHNPSLRIHLMAHSMGTVVAGWTLASIEKQIESLFLIQGALQSNIFASGHPLAGKQHMVKGYLGATISDRDEIFNKSQLLGDARLANAGFQGVEIRALQVGEVNPTSLRGAKFINVNANSVIGSHNGYREPEIARVHWALRGY